MIGYYVHHHGRGHLHRAQALAAALDEPVTGLSSNPRPARWRGPWVELPRDDTDPVGGDVTAGDQLHWVPAGHPGLRARSAAISRWLEADRPRLVVVDVSVEVALLARLHGTPVVSVVLPGHRTDAAHLLGYRVSAALVAFSPAPLEEMVPGLPADIARRVSCIGAVSRFSPGPARTRTAGGPRHVVVLRGAGGGAMGPAQDAGWQHLAPGWRWTVAGGPGRWVEDVPALLRAADVVVTNAGEGSLADVAAHRLPAVVIPSDRPFAEQATTAHALRRGRWPAVVLDRFPESGWPGILDRAVTLDGHDWRSWCDGHAAERFAQVVAGAAPARTPGPIPA